MREHISSTYSTRKNLVLRTYYVWYGPGEGYMRVLSTWHGPVEEIRNCMRKLKQYALACVRGTGHLKLCVLVEYVLWIFASNSVYVEVRIHDCATLMMKHHLSMATPSLLTHHRSQQTTATNILYKASPFFWVALIFLRDRLPQARRAGAIYHRVAASDS